ncbi:MAG: hypothetical protein K2L39_00505 [Muribaculaceae bacterium]|nr:hypothetical protein [Muribaculaceae bacterium]
MDNSRILKGSLDIGRLAPADKDSGIIDFLDLIDCFRENSVSIYKEEGFDSHQYPYGPASILFYLPWKDALSSKEFDGISQSVFEMIASSLMQSPGIGREIKNKAWETTAEYKSDFGLDIFRPAPGRYASCRNDWHKNRAVYYMADQPGFKWPGNADSYLPNKPYSDSILEAEVERHKNMDGYSKHLANLDKKPLFVQFHQGVMAHKGASLQAYIEEVGSKICEANFYRHEVELSKEERRLSRATRKIYSMLNRDGKRQYISLDFAHGMFEYIDPLGNHIGEYRLTGDFNSPAQPDHGLKSDFKKFVR